MFIHLDHSHVLQGVGLVVNVNGVVKIVVGGVVEVVVVVSLGGVVEQWFISLSMLPFFAHTAVMQ